jgi:O-antigen ligase
MKNCTVRMNSHIKLSERLFFIFLSLFIFTLPTVLVYKIGGENGVSTAYLFLMLMVFLFIPSIIQKFFKKNFTYSSIFFVLWFFWIVITAFINGGIEPIYLLSVIVVISSFLFALNGRIGEYFFIKLLSLSMVLSLIGVILFYAKLPLIDFSIAGNDQYFSIGHEGYFRAMSLFTNPNAFGYYLIFSIPVLISLRKNIGTLYFYFNLLLFLFALLLTTSRSSIASIVMLIPIYIILYFTNSCHIRKVFLNTVFFFLLFCFFLILLFLPNLEETNVRFIKWQSVFNFYYVNWEYIFTGAPFGINLFYMGESFSDNMFLYIFIKNGLIGLLFFLLALWFVMIKAIRVLIKSKKYRNYEIGCSYFMVLTLIPLFFSNFMLFFPISVLFGIASGVVIRARELNLINSLQHNEYYTNNPTR